MIPPVALFSVLKGSLWRKPPGPYVRSRWYPYTVIAVKFFAFARVMVSVIALLLSDGEPVHASDGVAIKVIGALVAVSAAIEWIPYRLCVWIREPSFLRRGAVPMTSIVCISLAAAMCVRTWTAPRRDIEGKVTRNQNSNQFSTSATGLMMAALAAVVSNSGLWYYVCSGPAASYFSHYAPTLVKKRRGREPISTDMGVGPCARLFAQQQSFSRYQYATPTRRVSIAETALIPQTVSTSEVYSILATDRRSNEKMLPTTTEPCSIGLVLQHPCGQ